MDLRFDLRRNGWQKSITVKNLSVDATLFNEMIFDHEPERLKHHSPGF
jgi:hypothetical protein